MAVRAASKAGVSVITVAEIWIYPVKGLRGLRVERAIVEPWGLQGDRRWMLVDAEGRFVTQRETPELARITAELTPEGVALEADGFGRVEAVTPASDAPRIEVQIWRDRVFAARSSSDISAWLETATGVSGLGLVHMSDPGRARPLNPDHGAPGDHVSFADGAPLLLATQASLDDLNRRLARPVPMDRFRPSLVLSGAEPWAEDGWSNLRLPAAELKVDWPCDRCIVTTTDQATGERSDDGEPLRTLRSFHHDSRGRPLFGWNLIPRRAGLVAIGEAVEAA